MSLIKDAVVMSLLDTVTSDSNKLGYEDGFFFWQEQVGISHISASFTKIKRINLVVQEHNHGIYHP